MLRNTLNGKSCFIQRTLFELNIVTLRRLLATYIQKIKLNSRLYRNKIEYLSGYFGFLELFSR